MQKKHSAKKLIPTVYFVLAAALFTLYAVSQFASAGAQLATVQPPESILQSTTFASTIQPANDTVIIGVWLVNVFDFEYKTGSYTMDMYTYFFWSNPSITTIDWHFANGYAITPTSITLVGNTSFDGTKLEVYRAAVRLNSPPDASNYPLDKVNLTVSIDMFTHGNNLTFTWLTNSTGIDPQFVNPGWKTENVELSTSVHSYPLGFEVPRAEMVVTQERQRVANSYSPFVPPIIFSIVCAVSFLFSLKEMPAVGLRIGLNTSMLVTTLLFSFGVSDKIPPSHEMVLYTIFLLCVLIFMVCNLIVTIIGVVGWFRYKNEKRTNRANRLGFLISIAVPVIIFIILYLVRL